MELSSRFNMRRSRKLNDLKSIQTAWWYDWKGGLSRNRQNLQKEDDWMLLKLADIDLRLAQKQIWSKCWAF